MISEELLLLPTKDDQQIGVWQVSDDTNQLGQHILMLHGAFSDKRILLGLAHYLAEYGHRCYLMEWRGRGSSSVPKEDFNLETIALNDVDATLHYLINELKLPSIHAITHSGGGICLTMCLIQNPHYIHKIASISMFACQVFAAALTPKRYGKVLMAKTMTKAIGYLPAKRLKLGPFNESYATMKQWFDWNLNKNFCSSYFTAHQQPFDYRTQMTTINIPIYSIAAAGDTDIAPPQGCQLFLQAFGNPDNQFREFALSKGNLEDYNHSRIMMSRNAATEVWPSVLQWIERHSLSKSSDNAKGLR